MQTGKEFFVHELTDILDGERRLLDALEQQAEESTNPQMQKLFQQHHQQTQKQIERLEQCFEEIGEEPEETECHGIMGLIQEREAFLQEDPSEDLIDLFNAGAALKVEHYEINSYESLIELADQMQLKKVSKLLNQNLKEEQSTAQKIEKLSAKLKPQMMEMEAEEGMEEEEGAAMAGQSRGRGSRSAGRSQGQRGGNQRSGNQRGGRKAA